MSESETHEGPLRGDEPGIDPGVARAVGLVAVLLIVGAVVAVGLLRKPPPPAPADVAADPLLNAGREVYLSRCVSCHGEAGRGDGPIAKGLAGPPVGDLTDARWKHGDAPDQVLAVVREGVKDTAMPGWGKVFAAEDVKAVTAYVYHLGRREVPATLRAP